MAHARFVRGVWKSAGRARSRPRDARRRAPLAPSAGEPRAGATQPTLARGRAARRPLPALPGDVDLRRRLAASSSDGTERSRSSATATGTSAFRSSPRPSSASRSCPAASRSSTWRRRARETRRGSRWARRRSSLRTGRGRRHRSRVEPLPLREPDRGAPLDALLLHARLGALGAQGRRGVPDPAKVGTLRDLRHGDGARPAGKRDTGAARHGLRGGRARPVRLLLPRPRDGTRTPGSRPGAARATGGSRSTRRLRPGDRA